MKILGTTISTKLFVIIFVIGFWTGVAVGAYFWYTVVEPDFLCDTFWQFLSSVECIAEQR